VEILGRDYHSKRFSMTTPLQQTLSSLIEKSNNRVLFELTAEQPEEIQVRNPRTGEFDYSFEAIPPSRLAQLCANMRTVQQCWYHSGISKRKNILIQWRSSLVARKDALLEALSIDTGRRVVSEIEFSGVISRLDWWLLQSESLLKEPYEISSCAPAVRYRNQLVPYHVVGIISPWNFPLLLSCIDAIPALLAGCAVIIKPSSLTPRFARVLQESIEAVSDLAPYFKIALGGGGLGFEMVSMVDALCFTGSTAVGRLLAMEASRNFIPAFLELGGNDPAIVLPSANVENAVKAILRGSVIATGQACQSIERVYVHKSVHDEFLDRLINEAAGIELSYPDPDKGLLGPIISTKLAYGIRDKLADARNRGAICNYGGELETWGGGLWFRPTILSHVNHSMRIMTEETFGPIIPVMEYDLTPEAITLANDSVYGLSAAVFSENQDEAERIALQLNAGGISINDCGLTSMVVEAEKNSFNLSGFGASRMGASGMMRFFRKKALLLQQGPVAQWQFFSEYPH
jgi:acyl-CoA reductase-like NAD-dependent aldehyde dehydrogenase